MTNPHRALREECSADLQRGDKIAAIKRVRENLGLDLAAAKRWVEEIDVPLTSSGFGLAGAPKLPGEAIAALNDGDLIAAIRHLRDASGLGLKDAKERVEAYLAVTPEIRQQFQERRSQRRGRVVPWVLAIAAVVAAVIYLMLKAD